MINFYLTQDEICVRKFHLALNKNYPTAPRHDVPPRIAHARVVWRVWGGEAPGNCQSYSSHLTQPFSTSSDCAPFISCVCWMVGVGLRVSRLAFPTFVSCKQLPSHQEQLIVSEQLLIQWAHRLVREAPVNLQGWGWSFCRGPPGLALKFLSLTNYSFQPGLAARWKFQILLHVYIELK